MSPDVHVLGIRHHGPGSARAVALALEQIGPAVVVIEGPPELDAIVGLVADPGMCPPVAGLVYDVDAPRRATFYPLAAFSPEWVAMRWGLAAGVPVRFADLAATNRLAPEAGDVGDTAGDDSAGGTDSATGDRPPEDGPAGDDSVGDEPAGAGGPPIDEALDPIGALAAAGGYDDAERWWEDAIEQRVAGDGALARFAAIADAMAEFRSDLPAERLDRDLLLAREASMRTILRSILKQTDGPIAMVCGAFHASALDPDSWPTAASDRAMLKGMPKTKVAATWAPWTAGRLAFASGYGAGVTAPRWYEHLFVAEDDVVARWMVDTARLLRDQGYDASAASAVEATRLADTLAAMRGRPATGLDEVNDAAETVLASGSALAMATISHRLLVGSTLGTVPESTPMVPLAKDLERQAKTLRLTRSAAEKTITLDLRREPQLARSVFFRRLAILGIDWARPVSAGPTGGTFKEAWVLEWRPELAVTVIEASLYGTTVESAAAARVTHDAAGSASLQRLAELVESCLSAELPDALDATLEAMAARTATAPDQSALMQAIEPLARTRRYGDVRGVDTSRVHDVLATMTMRAAIGLAVACASLDDDAAAEMRRAIESVERGVSLVADPGLTEEWRDALARLSPTALHGEVAGAVTRILLDAGRLDDDGAARRLSRALSPAVTPAAAAAWLDGFLSGDVALLLHDRALFGLIDAWVSGLDPTDFDDLLPLIRRTFARFEKAERRRIGELVSAGTAGRHRGGSQDSDQDLFGLDMDRAMPAVREVAELLGLTIGDRP